MATEGTFILADISGYTSFLSGVGLEHAKVVTGHLFNSMLKANEGHWKLANIEGDCIFFYCEGREEPTGVLGHIQNLYDQFCGQIIEVSGGDACPCGACTRINHLALKFIVHTGEFGLQKIGRRQELFGPDVVVAHRLLKNSIPIDEYVLLTDNRAAGLHRLGLTAIKGRDEYEDIGPVQYTYFDLEPLRYRIEATNRFFLTPDQARIRLEIDIEAPPGTVWAVAGDLEKREQWQGLRKFVELPSRRGRIGQVHQCTYAHGGNVVEVTTALDEASRRMTVKTFISRLIKDAYATVEVSERPGGGSRFGFYMTFKERIPVISPAVSGLLRLLVQRFQGRSMRRLKAMCEAEAALAGWSITSDRERL